MEQLFPERGMRKVTSTGSSMNAEMNVTPFLDVLLVFHILYMYLS